jgi:hypothetical protein
MSEHNKIWQLLESLPGLAAVTAEWKSTLGSAYELFKPFLRPRDELAKTIPCPVKSDYGCFHQVVKHGNDDYVAVCSEGCKTSKVNKSDIIIYEVSRSDLYRAICKALKFDYDNSHITNLRLTECIGSYAPIDGQRFTVYMTIQIEPEGFHNVATKLVAENDGPFILLAPTHQHVLT